MLGPLISRKHWQWAAHGKHPSARDYFTVGQDFPLMKGVASLIDNAYGLLGKKMETGGCSVSWRFWGKGSKEGTLLCGIVRDNSDALGRPYPLLAAGSGPLDGWEKHWDLLPFACEQTWARMEYISAQSFEDVKKLEDALAGIKPPVPEWSDFESMKERLLQSSAAAHSTGATGPVDLMASLHERAASMTERQENLVLLDEEQCRDQFTLLVCWHALFKIHNRGVPNFCFMGGALDKSFLIFVRRPLTSADFVKMWSVSSEKSLQACKLSDKAAS